MQRRRPCRGSCRAAAPKRRGQRGELVECGLRCRRCRRCTATGAGGISRLERGSPSGRDSGAGMAAERAALGQRLPTAVPRAAGRAVEQVGGVTGPVPSPDVPARARRPGHAVLERVEPRADVRVPAQRVGRVVEPIGAAAQRDGDARVDGGSRAQQRRASRCVRQRAAAARACAASRRVHVDAVGDGGHRGGIGEQRHADERWSARAVHGAGRGRPRAVDTARRCPQRAARPLTVGPPWLNDARRMTPVAIRPPRRAGRPVRHRESHGEESRSMQSAHAACRSRRRRDDAPTTA